MHGYLLYLGPSKYTRRKARIFQGEGGCDELTRRHGFAADGQNSGFTIFPPKSKF